jgi:hypothetical protein
MSVSVCTVSKGKKLMKVKIRSSSLDVQSRWLVSEPGFEAGTSQIRLRIFTDLVKSVRNILLYYTKSMFVETSNLFELSFLRLSPRCSVHLCGVNVTLSNNWNFSSYHYISQKMEILRISETSAIYLSSANRININNIKQFGFLLPHHHMNTIK